VKSLKVDTTDTAKGDIMYPTSQVTGRVHYMSKKHFTEEQMLALQWNPCVARVSSLSVSFTEEFKRKAYGELLSGKPIWQIFKDHGIDTDALGPVRVMKFQQFVNNCAKRGDGFKNMRNTWHAKKSEDDETSISKRFTSLENEVAYLRQVVEFLKKIRQADSEAKK
jgi:hypothetical protein